MKYIGLIALCLVACSSSQDRQSTSVEAPISSHMTTVHKGPTTPKMWSYVGLLGPENWGQLSPEYKTCETGPSQSPINLIWSKPLRSGRLQFKYRPSPISIVDNGHTIRINVSPGNILDVRGQLFELQQIHFHTRSEHTISSSSFPMEIHYVHKNSDNKIAVLGFFAIVGSPNPIMESILIRTPDVKYREILIADMLINPMDMMPRIHHHYHYMGSLTTPPCSEGVNWNVLNTPITLSKEQVMRFKARYPKNNRPIQPTHDRRIVNY